ncbi:O-antigen ligase family protein [Croceiramulus getboli]|nr:O-antigen ligase family protein [Flavobacteriaceae bacterium YJPT1-3]
MSKLSPKYHQLYVQIILLHAAIGFAIYLFRPLGLLYFVGAIVFFLYKIFKRGNRNNEALIAAAYMTGAEVFFRMTTSGIPYETGKYSVICFLLIGLFFSGSSRKSAPYWLYLLILIPGIIVSAVNLNYSTDVRNAIIFNLSGPFCLGIAALYCFHRRITVRQYRFVLWSLLFPIVTMTVYLFFYTPDTREVLSGTASNFALSGGFGPNQVATVIGIGMFVLFVELFSNSRTKLLFFLNLGLLLFLSYRAIITFSRGGVVTAVIMSVIFVYLFFNRVNAIRKAKISFSLILIGIAIAGLWTYSSYRTMGLIDKRYANQDAAGRVKESISTGREELISSELTFFVENPVTGIGVGKTREYRMEKYGILAASHNEVSRLLSEHGILGLLALFLLILVPLIFRIQNRKNILFYSFLAFWFLTINHSSMRIAAPAFLYALALMNLVTDEKTTVRRQPALAKG